MHHINQIEAIQRVQDYIEINWKSPITLRQLAQVSHYSPSHTERLFKELTQVNLFTYIRQIRLTEAAKEMRNPETKKTILDFSLDYLFDSHEGFTRAFSKAFGVSPKRYQTNPIPIPYFKTFGVKGYFAFMHQKKEKTMNTKTVFVQVMERPKRKAIIKRGIQAKEYFTYCEEVGCDVWGILESIPEALFEPAGFWLPKHLILPHTSEYVQGVEVSVDYAGIVPEGFDLISLDGGLFMVFQGEPYPEESFMDAIGEVWQHLASFDPKLYGYEWDVSLPRFQLEPRGYRGYIESRGVKKLS